MTCRHCGWTLACGIVIALTTHPVPSLGQGASERADSPRVPARGTGGDARTVIQARNLVVDRGPEGWVVTDFIQARRAGGGAGPSGAHAQGVAFVYPLPRAAVRPTVLAARENALPAFIVGDRLHAAEPLPPGEHLFVVRYGVEGPHFAVPLPGTTESVDVLVRQPAPATEVEGLDMAGTVRLDEGEPFLHFAGEGLGDDLLRLRSGAESVALPAHSLALVLAIVLLGVGTLAWRPRPLARGTGSSREALIRSVAEIDEALEGMTSLGAEEREVLGARRRDLIRRLTSSRSGCPT